MTLGGVSKRRRRIFSSTVDNLYATLLAFSTPLANNLFPFR
jgi:hypothetical protein